MATLRQYTKELLRRFVRFEMKSDRVTLDTLAVNVGEQDLLSHRSYSDIPGPKPIPLLGNTWRFLPYIGIIELIE